MKTIQCSQHKAVAAVDALQKLANASLPPRVSFAVAGLSAYLTQKPEVIATFKVRADLLTKHGLVDGNVIRITPDKIPAFNKEYAPIAETLISLSFEPLPLALLDAESIRLTPEDCNALSLFVDWPEPQKAEVKEPKKKKRR